MSILDMVWNQLQNDIQAVKDEVDIITTRTERAETAGGVPSVTFAQLPRAIDGAGPGNKLFCTNGRKTGEAAGAGTGVPVYYNPPTDTWFRYSDDTAVSV